jgi:hypothetical protein
MFLLWCQGDIKLHFINEIILKFMRTVITLFALHGFLCNTSQLSQSVFCIQIKQEKLEGEHCIAGDV